MLFCFKQQCTETTLWHMFLLDSWNFYFKYMFKLEWSENTTFTTTATATTSTITTTSTTTTTTTISSYTLINSFLYTRSYGLSHLTHTTTMKRFKCYLYLQMKKLRLKDIKRLVQVHPTNSRQGQKLSWSSVVLDPMLVTIVLLSSLMETLQWGKDWTVANEKSLVHSWITEVRCPVDCSQLSGTSGHKGGIDTCLYHLWDLGTWLFPNSFAFLHFREAGNRRYRQGARVSCFVPFHWCQRLSCPQRKQTLTLALSSLPGRAVSGEVFRTITLFSCEDSGN